MKNPKTSRFDRQQYHQNQYYVQHGSYVSIRGRTALIIATVVALLVILQLTLIGYSVRVASRISDPLPAWQAPHLLDRYCTSNPTQPLGPSGEKRRFCRPIRHDVVT